LPREELGHRVDAAQLEDLVAHRRLHQHGEVAAGGNRDDHLAHRDPEHLLGELGERQALAGVARAGRGLALTEIGHVVFRYADEIFSLGREMQDVLKGRPRGRPIRLHAGISDVLPKLIAYRVLQPALAMEEQVHLVCSEDKPERLVADLAAHGLDVVLTDAPVTSSIPVKAFNHLLGSCGVSVFASPPLAAGLRKKFPKSLDGAPFLMPVESSAMRRSLEQWCDTHGVRPHIVGEFQDSALMKTFGQGGAGVFAAPDAIEAEVRATYKVGLVGRLDGVVERFYAISIERKLKHPAVLAISEAARDTLFGAMGKQST